MARNTQGRRVPGFAIKHSQHQTLTLFLVLTASPKKAPCCFALRFHIFRPFVGSSLFQEWGDSNCGLKTLDAHEFPTNHPPDPCFCCSCLTAAVSPQQWPRSPSSGNEAYLHKPEMFIVGASGRRSDRSRVLCPCPTVTHGTDVP